MSKLKLIRIDFLEHPDGQALDDRLIITGRFFGNHIPVSPFITFGILNKSRVILAFKSDALTTVIVNEFIYKVCGTPICRNKKFMTLNVTDVDTFKFTFDIEVHGK